MKEPKRIPLNPTAPRVRNVKTIPMPSIRHTEEEQGNGFWEFVAEHEESRLKWLRQQGNENNTQSDQT